jgi:hypothetical protein
MDADSREFMRELTLRHEQATRSMIEEFRRSTDAVVSRLDAGTEALRKMTAQMERDHAEFRDEMRAQRQALFRLFDRLDGGGSAAGA